MAYLSEIRPGEKAVYLGCQSGREAINRLTSLGFTPGAEVSMLQNYGHGPLVVVVRGARVALGREEAKRIQVGVR